MSLMTGSFAALGQRNYRLFWIGSTLATTAFMMSFMLVPSVAFEITGSNAAAGLAQMGSGIGMLFVSPIGGVIADRMRKKPLVFAGQAIPAAVILTTGILVLTDVITVPMLTIATLIMGLGFAFMGPARTAWVGELVERELFPNAVALQQIAQNVSQVAAPALIALLVGTVLPVGGAYLFMASLFAIVLPITAWLPNTKRPSGQVRSVRSELAAGLGYVWRQGRLRILWLGFIGIVVCGFAFQTLLPGLLSEELGRDPTEIGMVFLALAVAGLVTTVPLAGVVRTRYAWPVLVVAGFTMSAGFLLLAGAPTYLAAIAAGVPLGIGRSAFMLVDNALLLSNAEPAFHGRVMSLAMMGFGSQALLAPVWGALADAFGVRTTLLAVGLAAAAVTTLLALGWLGARRTERDELGAPPPGARPVDAEPSPAGA
ncbi:MAG: MFS transporter [Acidimicrobiia bacterium]